MNTNRKTRLVSLFFNGSSSCQSYLSLPMNVKEIHIKQLSVLNTNGSTANVPLGFLKSNLVTSDQTLCVINADNNTQYNLMLDTILIPSSNIISGNYNFYLVKDEQTPLVGDASLQIYVNLLLDFLGN